MKMIFFSNSPKISCDIIEVDSRETSFKMNESHAALRYYGQLLLARSTGLVFLESFVSGFFFMATLIGNFLVLWFVYRNPSLRTIPNQFVISLAVSDILMAVTSAPPCMTILINGSRLLGDFFCQFQGFCVAVLACISLQTMTLMALNRFYLIVKPDKYKAIFNRRYTKIMIISAWFLACTEPLPYLISGHRYVFHPAKYFCFQDMKVDFVTLLIYAYVALPMVVLTPCYFKVFKVIRLHNNRISCMRTAQAKAVSQISIEDIKVTQTLFLTICGFLICWVPISLVDIMDFVHGDWSLPRQVYFMYSIFGQVSTAINPLIYGMMNKTFREEYRKLYRALQKPFKNCKCNFKKSRARDITHLEELQRGKGFNENLEVELDILVNLHPADHE